MVKSSSLIVLMSLLSGTALASAIYPGTVKNTLGLQSVPQCTLCHQTNTGGTGTATRPFAVTARGLGLSGNDTTKLNEVLDTMETTATDSDGDGMGDIEELRNGRNPNVADMVVEPVDGGDGGEPDAGEQDAGEPPREIPEPSYGCSAFGGGLAGGITGLLVFALLAVSRRKTHS